MTKHAHITNRPNHSVGDKVLGLCGKEWKVTMLWDDLPKDKPICRKCVDTALRAMSEADTLIETLRGWALMITARVNLLNDGLDQDLILDQIAENDLEHRVALDAKREAKAEKKRAKQTCTCTWSKKEIVTVDPNCPIHGDLVPTIEDVELPERDEPTPGSVQRSEED